MLPTLLFPQIIVLIKKCLLMIHKTDHIKLIGFNLNNLFSDKPSIFGGASTSTPAFGAFAFDAKTTTTTSNLCM